MFDRISRATLPIFIILLSSAGIYFSARLAIADSLSSSDSLPDRYKATALVPGNSINWQRLARLQQQRGTAPLDALSRAVEVSPLNVDAWIELGLEQELRKDLRSSETTLLHAAGLSREYVPRWTLANFYFRRNDTAHFLIWAHKALEMGYVDLQPIFRMAWALSGDSGRIEREMLPDSRLVLRQYLSWLTSAGKLDPASRIFSRLAANAEKEDLTALENYCEAQLASGHFVAAKEAWNAILSRRLLPGPRESPGTTLTNATFTHEPLNTGFDWRTPAASGINVRPTWPGLRISLSGKQPEACELLWQYVMLEKSRSYELSYLYETSGIASDSGLYWRVLDTKTGAEISSKSKNLSREKSGWETTSFLTPGQAGGGRLVLSYQRVLGTTRISGWVQLNAVLLKALN
jgi:tetratricopeptide (TPR) repeat protein